VNPQEETKHTTGVIPFKKKDSKTSADEAPDPDFRGCSLKTLKNHEPYGAEQVGFVKGFGSNRQLTKRRVS